MGSDLHSKIMNLPIPEITNSELSQVHSAKGTSGAYKKGHRDARHQAAELALEHDEKLTVMSEQLEEYVNGVRRIRAYCKRKNHYTGLDHVDDLCKDVQTKSTNIQVKHYVAKAVRNMVGSPTDVSWRDVEDAVVGVIDHLSNHAARIHHHIAITVEPSPDEKDKARLTVTNKTPYGAKLLESIKEDLEKDIA